MKASLVKRETVLGFLKTTFSNKFKVYTEQTLLQIHARIDIVLFRLRGKNKHKECKHITQQLAALYRFHSWTNKKKL